MLLFGAFIDGRKNHVIMTSSTVIVRALQCVLPPLAFAFVRIKSESVYPLHYGIQNAFQTTREKTESPCTRQACTRKYAKYVIYK